MKSLYKMTDEEVIGMVMGNSNISFALNNKSGSFNLQGCVNLAKEEIAKYFKKSNGQGRHLRRAFGDRPAVLRL